MRLPRTLVAATLVLAACGAAWAQTTAAPAALPNAARAAATEGAGGGAAVAGSPSAVTGNPAQSAGARFVEACQQAIERGMVNPGCQGPLYASEIARLKEDALRTHNPNLLTLLGDAYQSNRSGVSDIGQAYRWYLLGAVRGDPRAMQRLSELYQSGRGVAPDPIKALGYARLVQRLAPSGSASAQQATRAIATLAQEMAAEEMALADRFANELEQGLRQPPPGAAAAAAATTDGNAPAATSPAQPLPNAGRLPGLGAAQNSVPVPAPAATTLPGRERLSEPPTRQP